MPEFRHPDIRRRRATFRLLWPIFGVGLWACGETVVEPTPVPIAHTDFSFLVGNWQGQVTWTDPAGAAVPLDAVMSVGTLFDGRVVRQTWRATVGAEEVEVSTHRTRVGSTSQWLVARADGLRRTMTVLEGAFDEEGISLVSGVRLGTSAQEREVFSSIEDSVFTWTLEASVDGGASWAPVLTGTYRPSATGTAGRPAAAQRCAGAEYRAFDFWAGDWQVFGSGGAVAGSNVIRPVAGGCALQENWDDGAIPGTSLNMYDPRMDRWTQLWMDANGFTLELGGGLDDSTMELTGARRGTSGTVIDRIRWSPLQGGEVRQLWETRNGPDGAWSVLFNGTYSPR